MQIYSINENYTKLTIRYLQYVFKLFERRSETSFGFPLKYGGTIGVSVSFARANAVSGVTVRIPAGGRKKVKMNLEYVSTPYTVYRVDSNGKKHFYTHNHSFPIICGHDYRVVKA